MSLLQGEPRGGLCGARGFRHVQQGAALLQRQVQPGPAPDAGGVRRVRHVRTAAGRLPGPRGREQDGHREVRERDADATHTRTHRPMRCSVLDRLIDKCISQSIKSILNNQLITLHFHKY